MELAVKQINGAGGIVGRELVVLGQHWAPLAWTPTHPSEIFDDLKTP